MASPNVMATLHDITYPEARSTAQAVRKLFEDGGSAAAPWVAGMIAMRWSLHVAILATCVVTWLVCGALLAAAAKTVSADIDALRGSMRDRADRLGSSAAAGQPPVVR